jgi:hypothetical protein
MALTRVWTPTNNYSSGGSKRLIVLHTMEGFTGPNGAYDCAIYFKGDVGASSQVCIDNNRGKIWECVTRTNGSWTQCQYNYESVSAEQSGYASWSRDYWLNERYNELRNTADWIAEESAKLGIPIVKLSESQAQGGGRGICHHMNLGSAGCGHSDCGSNYPIDDVIAWAKGGTIQEEVEDMTPSVVFWHNDATGEDTLHEAMRWADGRVCYRGPGTGGGFWSVDDNSNSKSGVGIAVSKKGVVVITYVNQNNDVCHYERQRGDSPWNWIRVGGDA